jgi:hypothetical protein
MIKFWLRDSENHPVTLVVYELLLKDNSIKYATATRHPSDEPKVLHGQRLEHVIAEGRFKKGMLRMCRYIALRHVNSMIDITNDMMFQARANGRELTRWALVAKEYENTHQSILHYPYLPVAEASDG